MFTVDRVENGQSREFTTTVDVTATQRWTSKDATAPTTVGAIGVAPEVFAHAVQPAVGGARDVRVHR